MLKDIKSNLNKKGFTLIELIVVIAIIAILAAVLIPRFTGFTESAREKSAISDTRNVLVAVEAMLAEGQTNLAQGDTSTAGTIEYYAGKNFAGTMNPATGLNSDTFTYYVDIGTKRYTVSVSSGTIDETFNDGTGSTSGPIPTP
ncbi:prepilin-type N-terminal cleavage/methylation domain-containing protein [Papillibacter cinnamivorans]|uniref:Type IV pilus assembly protein PilA n=1 Tax=Papillibacter cinnamivorans DSM 12816 TaxID=1122930 RepID=A0A1W1Z2T2_9FIRM|nr:prepilin-type N-terminal cleavage/methylation domain-containing protein [Papillibacter cinnamivorans]SMC42693.1 type IV pilus assembly protein PilA [Papillibacter cinnamivorans DSM 12816]